MNPACTTARSRSVHGGAPTIGASNSTTLLADTVAREPARRTAASELGRHTHDGLLGPGLTKDRVGALSRKQAETAVGCRPPLRLRVAASVMLIGA